MAATLRRLGGVVTRRLNANQAEMESVIEAFGQQLRKGGVGLFYFANHGVQVGGVNYLVPIGARINREQDVKIAAVDVGRVLGAMEDAKNDLNIIILDACRNNPFARSFRSQVQGLAPVDAPRGSLIKYATAPGSVASDGNGRNGLYTENLLRYIMTPGLSVEQVFKQVRKGVMQATADQQTPWEASSLRRRGHDGTCKVRKHSEDETSIATVPCWHPRTPRLCLGKLWAAEDHLPGAPTSEVPRSVPNQAGYCPAFLRDS